ncbi:hypothetical protein PFICI_14139 [Pestalotiopsis fici W106-1]|uniref:Uncharacterized protein n=1 Tax=Pestalotiopsis fici (strain W106-1 / CGMCC3.15140) TaxID=1229662 RepID=W3WK97_PESFW|nr:uncharacterized protein PFICI_14139 [Pestalotiopsis fici W106-1]ETS74273.1 hypothetical protein PFICI_14139 [Pestalotiopsis fici W106-1]
MVTTRSQASRLATDIHKNPQQQEGDNNPSDSESSSIEEQRLPHPKPLLAPELDLLRWITEMREKLDHDSVSIGSCQDQLEYFYASLGFRSNKVIGSLRSHDMDKYQGDESGGFDYWQTLRKLQRRFLPELEEQKYIKSLDAKPGQKIHLLDLPQEIIMCIAHWCHYQPRRTTNPDSHISNNPQELQIPIGGGLDRLSQVSKFVRSLVVPLMFSRVELSCFRIDLAQCLGSLLELEKFLPHVRMFGLVVCELEEPPRSISAAERSDDERSAISLISALKAMSGLREFALYIEDLEDNLLAEISNLVRDSELRLPLLTGLRISRNCSCDNLGVDDSCVSTFPLFYALASMGPNVERASLDFEEVFKTRQVPGLSGFGDLPKLVEVRFKRGAFPLSNANILTIVEAFPRLQRLDLPEPLETRSPKSLIPILSLLTDLEFLALCIDPENPESIEDFSRLQKKKCIAEDFFLQCHRLQHIYLKSHFSSRIGHTTDAFVRLNHSARSQYSQVLQPWVEVEKAFTQGHFDRDFPLGRNYEVSPIWNAQGFPRIMQLGWRPRKSHSPTTWNYFKEEQEIVNGHVQSRWAKTEFPPYDSMLDREVWQSEQAWEDFR